MHFFLRLKYHFKIQPDICSRNAKEENEMELVLNSYGAKLSIDNNAFVVSNAAGTQRIPCDSIDSIMVARSTVVTSDALMLAVDCDIPVRFADKAGNNVGCVWSHKYGSISTIRKGQLAFTASAGAVSWIKEVIVKKMQNQQALLFMVQADSDDGRNAVDAAVSKIGRLVDKVKNLSGDTVREVAAYLRAYEGNASKLYFQTLNIFVPEKFRFKERTQHPATDIANAMLNYGYGILYGKVENSLVRAGIDPYIGVLHRDEYGKPVLSYDVIELFRVWVDYVVYSLLAQDVVNNEYFSIDENGAVWLEGLGRRVVIQSMNDYLSETESVKGVKRSRETHIFLYAQNLAQIFKHY